MVISNEKDTSDTRRPRYTKGAWEEFRVLGALGWLRREDDVGIVVTTFPELRGIIPIAEPKIEEFSDRKLWSVLRRLEASNDIEIEGTARNKLIIFTGSTVLHLNNKVDKAIFGRLCRFIDDEVDRRLVKEFVAFSCSFIKTVMAFEFDLLVSRERCLHALWSTLNAFLRQKTRYDDEPTEDKKARILNILDSVFSSIAELAEARMDADCYSQLKECWLEPSDERFEAQFVYGARISRGMHEARSVPKCGTVMRVAVKKGVCEGCQLKREEWRTPINYIGMLKKGELST